MTPTVIGTQQQPWSLWHTNTSLPLVIRVLSVIQGFQRDSNPQAYPTEYLRECLPLFPEQYDAALYKEGRQPIVCMPGVSCVP